MTSPQKQAAAEFLRMVAVGEIRQAYARHVAPGFRHHNAWFAGDADSLMRGMEENHGVHPHKQLDIQRVLEDGALVAVHSHMRPKPGSPGMALMHIFRFEQGRIAELWDIGQPVPEQSPNEHGMF